MALRFPTSIARNPTARSPSLIDPSRWRPLTTFVTTDPAPGSGLSIDNVTSFGEDARGEIYVADRGNGSPNGEVYKIVPRS